MSACIVTYRCYDKCRIAIRSLLDNTLRVNLTVYIVDNNSGDGALDKLKAEFPEIICIQNSDNKGFGHGHNTVLPLLKSDFHSIVNPDITLDSDTVSDLVEYLLSHPDVGQVTPKILFPDGRDQQLGKRNPSFLALVGRHIFKKRLAPIVEHYQMLDEDLTKPVDIEFATGCFSVVRTELFKQLGGFDERWFMYFEDMDLTRRVRGSARAVYLPDFCVYHAWERSSSHHLKFFIILVTGMFKYFGKWGFQLR